VSNRKNNHRKPHSEDRAVSRRNLLLAGTTLAAASAVGSAAAAIKTAQAQQQPVGRRPNILVIFGDDIGMWNVGAYCNGMMGRTPNIDRIAKEGILFTDHYGQPSCTVGRAAFIMGQLPVRTGMTTIGIPGSTRGIQKSDPTLAEVLKAEGYATAQFGKNHLGDRNEFLPTVHGFDYWFGNLYHLNAEEEPEDRISDVGPYRLDLKHVEESVVCMTLRWRELDSNLWYRIHKSRDFPEAFRASAIIWQPRKACKFPVFSLLAGNFRDSETSSHMTPPPAMSLRTIGS